MKVSESFNRNLFWDVDPEKLDWKKNAHFIVERALVRGGMNDVKIIMEKYTKDQLINILKELRDLDALTHNFCSHYFNIPKEEMHALSQYY